jgi:hypothetical protein
MLKHIFIFMLFIGLIFGTLSSRAQSTGQAGTITGTITDPSGAVVPGAKAELKNLITGYDRIERSDALGNFRFLDVPPNNYHLEVSVSGFQIFQQDLSVRTSVPIQLSIPLKIATESTTVDVHSENENLVENVATAHTDIDKSLFLKLPTSSPGAGLSDAITLATPGVVADSNGFFHPIGDHAETGFALDNQPITDQQSKIFSTAMPLNAIESMEVIAGGAPAEYGDKTSLVINAITRSGLGQSRPFGSFSTSYGSFGTVEENFSFGAGTPKLGNFSVVDSVRSGRYLDSPEFTSLHDKGNNETLFDRIDYQPSATNIYHLNLFFSRAWFQTPNTFDQQSAGQDQRQQIRSFNIAPGYVHVFSPSLTLTLNPYFRHDEVQYFPSGTITADLPATINQTRTLGNLGLKADLSYYHGKHNLKAGVQVQHTFLNENFQLGVTDPALNPVCFGASGQVVTNPRFTDPSQCAGAGFTANPNVSLGLIPFDLTRNGRLFSFLGHTDVKEEALYLQDSISFGGANIQAGVREDIYRGLVSASAFEPRLGFSYLFKPTSTVFRLAYSRFFETPFNENLILSSATGAGGLATNVFGAFGSTPLSPGRRNQFQVGLQQAIASKISIDANYIWKYTDNAFDFDNLFSTPIVFPIEWRKSKIDSLAVRINLAEIKGFSAFTVLGHTRARFFGPENGGLIFNSPLDNNVFRIDHDQAFQQTTNLRYQYRKKGPWVAFTWRYDSGLVAGFVPDLATAFSLTGDQQAAIGLFCGNTFATVSSPITGCPAGMPAGATRVRIPAAGTENDDTNPPRIAPRNLFDVGFGIDNLFHTDRPRFTLQLTAVNITNEVSLYNFQSTFSGTHFVTPRGYTVQLGMVW